MQEVALGGLRPPRQRQLRQIAQQFKQTGAANTPARLGLKPGTRLMREWQGRTYDVVVLDDGFSWQGTSYRSISATARKIAGTPWSGAQLLPGLFLARIDGKSPVEYLTEERDKDTVRRVARLLLACPPDGLAEIRQVWASEIQAIS
jgi:hypothetical protein